MSQPAAALQPCCSARKELANQFAIAARLYAEAVVMLTRDSPDGNYDSLRQTAEEAQRRCEDAQAAFEEHVELHGCSR